MRQAASIGSRCTLSHLARLRALARAAAQPVTVSAFRTPPTSFQVALGPGHCQADPPQWFVDGYVIHVARCCSTGRGGCVACTDDRRKRLPMCVCMCVWLVERRDITATATKTSSIVGHSVLSRTVTIRPLSSRTTQTHVTVGCTPSTC